MVSSRKFNSRRFKSRVSNPRSEYIESCVRPQWIQHFSQDRYACKNSKPQGLEEIWRLEFAETGRTASDLSGDVVFKWASDKCRIYENSTRHASSQNFVRKGNPIVGISSRKRMAVSTLFVTMASTETLNGTIWVWLVFLPSRSAKWGGRNKSYTQNCTVPFRKTTHYDMSLQEQSRTPHVASMCQTSGVRQAGHVKTWLE